MADRRYWLETLGCPKNQVDSDKLEGVLGGEGLGRAGSPEEADLVVVNTCAFIESARQESIDTVLSLAATRRTGARLVVTGCMAERYGDELAAALPEVDLVAGFGESLTTGWPAVPVTLGVPRRSRSVPTGTSTAAPVPVSTAAPVATSAREAVPGAGGPTSPAAAPLAARPPSSFDLLELPRPAPGAPWAYLKVAEGCDRICGFCAIPSFRGRQRSRPFAHVLAEAEALAAGGAREIVLVAQDLASYARDRTGEGVRGARAAGSAAPIVGLTRAVGALVPRVRLLYLYPTGLTPALIDAVLSTGVPYFDLSLQHVSRPLLARMRRWGHGDRFLERIATIRAADRQATFRSSFILGYPGETEEDHDQLLAFLQAADLDWAGFFPFSPEAGTHALGLPDQVAPELAMERLRECAALQDSITAAHRDALVGQRRQVLVDAPGVGRTVHEAPEIDGVVQLSRSLPAGALVDVVITASLGIDLVAESIAEPAVHVTAEPAVAGTR